MAEEPGARVGDEELRQAYLYFSDPFHSWGHGISVVVVACIVTCAAESEGLGVWIPLAFPCYAGLTSAWVRWKGRTLEAAVLRKKLKQFVTLLRWGIPALWTLVALLLAGYGMVLWKKWTLWKLLEHLDEVSPEGPGDWRSLMFGRRDALILALIGIVAFISVWMTLHVRPRLRAALARP